MASPENVVYTAPQMVDLTAIDELRGRGARVIAYHPNGMLASVEFTPESVPADDTQHETPTPEETVKRRSTGRLVPRVDGSSP